MTESTVDPVPVHELLAATLVQHAKSPLFGLIGDGNLFMVNSYVEKFGGRYVPARHEAAAVHMAIGYAQSSGGLGVATVTHGPALANTAVPLIEAMKGGQPLLLIAGDTASSDRNHLQKFDQKAFIAMTGAAHVELASPETAASDLVRAIRIATLERRPVVFNMRIDLQWAIVLNQHAVQGLPSQAETMSEAGAIEEAAAILAAARRPIVLAGRGACDPQSREAILRLAQRIEAPLATTLKASGLFHGHAHDLGIFGGLSHSAAIDTILAADTVFAFGAGLNKFTSSNGELLKDKRVVHVIADAGAVRRHCEPLLTVIGSPRPVAESMIEMLDLAEIPGSGFADAAMAVRLSAVTGLTGLENELKNPDPHRISLLAALAAFNEALPSDRTLVTDLGRFVTIAWRALPVECPEALVNTAHFGAIGCGLPQAIGASMARSHKRTVLVCGDGGFALGGPSELATAIEQNLDLTILLCNDGSYGAEHIQFTARDMNPMLSLLHNPPFAEIARAYGFTIASVRTPDDLSDACALARAHKGPLFIELHVDPMEVPLI